MIPFTIRPAAPSDEARVLALAERLAAFGPTTRQPAEIANRERTALAEALARPSPASALLVAEHSQHGIIGVVLLDTRLDYFTGEPHGYVSILAVARDAEGQGVGQALLQAADDWGRRQGHSRLTLAVFTDNRRARELYQRQGWRPELEIWYKNLA